MDEKCEHPTWQEESDGHIKNGWRCTKCGTYQWIAPWVLNNPPKNDDYY